MGVVEKERAGIVTLGEGARSAAAVCLGNDGRSDVVARPFIFWARGTSFEDDEVEKEEEEDEEGCAPRRRRNHHRVAWDCIVCRPEGGAGFRIAFCQTEAFLIVYGIPSAGEEVSRHEARHGEAEARLLE